jgi:hypothetical protein
MLDWLDIYLRRHILCGFENGYEAPRYIKE